MNWRVFVLGAIVMFALALRWWGSGFGLPYLYHPDESVPVEISLRMLKTGDLNPGFYNWPSLVFYFNALAYLVLFGYGRLTGRFLSRDDLTPPDVLTIGVGKTSVPEELIFGRGAQVLVGALTIVLVYLVCRQITRRSIAGFAAALFLAVETIHTRNSQFIRPETLLVFFTLWATLFALKIIDDPRPRNYVLAAIGVGLAASSKYNAALGFIVILAAHLAHWGRHGFFRREIFIAALVSALAFFIGSPYALLDAPSFIRFGLLEDATHYSGGHAGNEGDTLRWYVELLWNSQGGLLLLALGEIIFSLVRRDRVMLVLASFPVLYFAFVNAFLVHFDSTILPVIPFLLILAARLIARAWTSRRIVQAALIALVIALALPPLNTTAQYNADLMRVNNRELARDWLEKNLPPGARVALEAYTPYLEPDRFALFPAESLATQPPEWFIANGIEYLVVSDTTFRQYYANPATFADWIAHYDALFTAFQLIQQFNERGTEIRIYQTNASDLPARRVQAHWGVYADWLELIGYDGESPQTLTLAWRGSTRRSQFTVTARLLNRDGNVIAQTVSRLTVPNRITRAPIKFNLPHELTPGIYNVELSISTDDLGIVPVVSHLREPVANEQIIGPFKVSPSVPAAIELQNATRANVQFGDTITLLAHSIASQNNSLNVTIFWQATKKMDKDYTVFVHVLDANGNLRTQVDRQPFSGAYPTSSWDANEIVRDNAVLDLQDVPPGKYRLAIGLYEFPSLARLPVNVSDEWILDEVTIQ
jgi:4-amino-4-deoxy-L-arabinose transferase-like glycosyltransferase